MSSDVRVQVPPPALVFPHNNAPAVPTERVVATASIQFLSHIVPSDVVGRPVWRQLRLGQGLPERLAGGPSGGKPSSSKASASTTPHRLISGNDQSGSLKYTGHATASEDDDLHS